MGLHFTRFYKQPKEWTEDERRFWRCRRIGINFERRAGTVSFSMSFWLAEIHWHRIPEQDRQAAGRILAAKKKET